MKRRKCSNPTILTMKQLVFLLLFGAICVNSLPDPKNNNKNKGDQNLGDLIPIPPEYYDGIDHVDESEDQGDDEDYEDYDYLDEDYADLDSTTQPPSPQFGTAKPDGDDDSSLLPMSLPAGSDLDQTALPIFLKEPSDTFALRSRPAKLHCRVAHAVSVHFSCNSEVIQPGKVEHHVEPETGIRYTEAYLSVDRDQVEEFFGDYHCACVAVSGKGTQTSKPAQIAYAYLKKKFETPPYSTQVEEGKQVELRCHPPRGRPTPKVYWTKNGEKIDFRSSSGLILSGSNGLIVVSAQISDSGSNFSCVAENRAGKRISQPATLTVSVNGGWSPWSPWSPCSARCGSGVQVRRRQCDHPEPKNNGAQCRGNNQQKRPCSTQCKGSPGDWSEWSAWSSCNSECFQHRSRTCDSSMVQQGSNKNSGGFCLGPDLDDRNCTGGFCQSTNRLVMYGSDANTNADNDSVDKKDDDDDLAMTLMLAAALSAALLVILAAAVLIFRAVRRAKGGRGRQNRNQPPQGYTLTSTDYGYGTSEDNNKKPPTTYSNSSNSTNGSGNNTAATALSNSNHYNHYPMSTQPLLMQPPRNNGPTLCYEYSYPDSNSNLNHHNKSFENQNHHYEQPMVVFPTGQSPADSIGKKTTSDSCSSNVSCPTKQLSQLRGCTSSGSPMSSGGTFDRNSNGNPNNNFPVITSTPLPPTPTSPHRPACPTTAPPPPPPLSPSASVDPKFTTWATVNANGARVSVPECGVALTVPPGALPPGQAADLFLSVLTGSAPMLRPGETLLSPVVVCGPKEASSRLKKPVTVSFPHSASLRHGNWSVSLRQNDQALSHKDKNSLVGQSNWDRVVTLGQETLNTPVYTQLDLNAAHVVTDRLTCLCLVGESNLSTGLATKSLRLAAFAQHRPNTMTSTDLTVRVYCLPDTDAALAMAQEQERRLFDGRLLDRPTAVLVKDNGGDLCLRLESLGNGWHCREGGDYLEVPFSHVWSSSANPPLHCSFTLRSNANSNSSNTNGSIHSRSSHSSSNSSGNNNNNSHTRLSFTLVANQESANAVLMSVDCDLSVRSNLNLGSNPYETCPPQPLSTTSRFRLSPAMLTTLAGLLDPPNSNGNDWRMLAERLNVHRYPAYFASRPSPTEAILGLWEARSRELLAVSNLGNVLRGMGRFDAASVLERDGSNGGSFASSADVANGNAVR